MEIARHSLAHVLAAAVTELYPKVKLGMGPATEDGFYYDFDTENPITETDLERIEKRMREIIARKEPFVRISVPKQEAIDMLTERNQTYKVEIILDIPDTESITLYATGALTDVCKGPHVENTAELKDLGWKLTRVAGAYWKGSEENAMLQRVYGIAFENKNTLKEWERMRAEALKRDHRKLGKELDLFAFSDLVGAGLPLYTPRGTRIIDALRTEVERICKKYGFEKIITPHVAKIDLYRISGHADKFHEELFKVVGHYKQELVLKPVQCPHHTQLYASRQRSYRDLPIRYMESNKQYRDEKPGQIGGLNRVIAITVEDGHSFCTVEQVKSEVENLIRIISKFYESVGLWGNHWVSLSVRDYDHPEKYIGEPEDWDTCESMLEEVSNELSLNAKRMEGEAAPYGPKLDFMFKDVLGNERQLATVQLDFATPKRFDLVYTNESGSETHPVMVHRAILGSYERFLAILIEHFGGNFPLWLSPEHVRICTVSEQFTEPAHALQSAFESKNIFATLDDSNESVGKKIRNASKDKVPYTIVFGEKEVSGTELAIRVRGQEKQPVMSTDAFIESIRTHIENRSLDTNL